MKKNFITLIVCIAALAACNTENNMTTENAEAVEVTQPDSLLRHVVAFSFKETSSPAAIDSVITAFEALPSQIETIKGFERGTNNSPEGLDKGFTHIFTLTFHDEAGRATYLPHPAHKAFGALLGPHLKDVLVLDYWTQPAK